MTMRYTVELAGRAVEVDVEALPDGRYRLRVDGGVPIEVEAEARPDRVHLRGGERTFSLAAAPRGDGLHVHARGHDAVLRVLDERLRRLRARAGGGFAVDGAQAIRSPMPGKIVAVLAKVGDTVAAGQGLVVVEAMKMENELRAAAPGVVARVHVAAGDRVESGAELILIEPPTVEVAP
jgi:biotin carboxyl carrier protein